MFARWIATVAALLLACAQASAHVRSERATDLGTFAAHTEHALEIQRSAANASPGELPTNPKTAPPARASLENSASGENASITHCHAWENWSPLKKCASGVDKYLYANGNPGTFIDPDGLESLSTIIDTAERSCDGPWCAVGYRFLGNLYAVGSLGFASVHDPAKDAYDRGEISGLDYAAATSGAVALPALSIATAGVGGGAVAATTTTTGRIGTTAALGAGFGAGFDAGAQAALINANVQENYNATQTVVAAGTGAILAPLGNELARGLARGADKLWTRWQTHQSKPPLIAESPPAPAAGTNSGVVVEDAAGSAPTLVNGTSNGAAGNSVPQVVQNKAVGDAARDAIAATRPGSLIEQNFSVTGGLRRVDVVDGTTAIESKVGRTSLGKRERQELARDAKLLRSGQVDTVEWHFSPSPTTGLSGPTPQLRAKLEKLGITIVE